MPGHECYHCKQWVDEGEAHDCWTTTEAALTRELSEDLRDAWERLRETATAFGEQRIYASHHSIMFARKSCYFFVRPKTKYLEVVFFVGRAIVAPQIRNVVEASKTRRAHIIRLTHRDEVEPPITDWLREAYDFCVAPRVAVAKLPSGRGRSVPRKKTSAPRVKTRAAAQTPARAAATRGRRPLQPRRRATGKKN